mgnify:CR=1 FL=1
MLKLNYARGNGQVIVCNHGFVEFADDKLERVYKSTWR